MLKKQLNQQNFIMNIILDLGMNTEKTIRPTRYAIFECTKCKDHFEANVQNSKKRKYCKVCQEEYRKSCVTFDLNQSEYKMKIIEDLGIVTANKDTKCLARYAIFECLSCKKHFKARCGSTTSRNQTTCQDCTLSENKYYKHPLYAIWNGIVQRCYNQKRKDYKFYGAKGITMCDEWKNNSDSFISWCLTNGWNAELQVDKDKLSKSLNINPPIYSPETISFLSCSENCLEKFN